MQIPPPEFVALVKDALENLYDPLRLGEHSLANQLGTRIQKVSHPVQALRNFLLDAIENLDPGPAVAAGARQRRLFQILELRYVEALPFRRVMAELGLSQTQYHRDQRHALEVFATVLWETPESASAGPGQSERGVSGLHLYAEVEAAAHRGDDLIDATAVAKSVVDVLRHVARGSGATLRENLAARPILVRANRTALRQLLITMTGYVLAGAEDGRLELATSVFDGLAELRLTYDGSIRVDQPHSLDKIERLRVAEHFVQTMGGDLRVEADGTRVIATARIPIPRKSLLVIDDNADIAQLVARFVADQDYTVLSASNAADGLNLVQTMRPDIVLLDIMMPGQDGWDALQALKQLPAMDQTPVLVCSILGESQLALSLGAADFIRKPLTRPVLLRALARWTAAPPQTAGARPTPHEPIPGGDALWGHGR